MLQALTIPGAHSRKESIAGFEDYLSIEKLHRVAALDLRVALCFGLPRLSLHPLTR